MEIKEAIFTLKVLAKGQSKSLDFNGSFSFEESFSFKRIFFFKASYFKARFLLLL